MLFRFYGSGLVVDAAGTLIERIGCFGDTPVVTLPSQQTVGNCTNCLLTCRTMINGCRSIPALRGPVPFAHILLQRFVSHGSLTVDATCGNGKDTLFLAELVGETGHVWAIDIQQEALDRTAGRLGEAGLRQRVTLINAGHERLGELIDFQVEAIVFNLGWLPGAAREVTTTAATTLQALQAALQLLRPGGLLLITCYPGHIGGDDEAAAVTTWCGALSPRDHFVWRLGQLNVADTAPYCLLVQDCRRSLPR